MLDELIEGYKPFAVRDDRLGNSVISYHSGKKLFLLSINGKLAGPFKLSELEALVENIKDVIDLKGCFNYTEEYDVRGNQIV